ncbi:methyltransferase domain-containing protein [Microcoleus sp. OTE_8_concoct_300]|uniref:methyltransferase domain-containing protein n=1 Tax=Microcoleus sp. OTE_8_concoct_300 TaxID=2964710 RepID=UPI00403F7DFE
MNPEAAKRLEAAIQKTLSTHAKSDKSYLWMAYWVIFEREADPDGLEGWLGLLNAGVSRASVVQTMIKSSEFYQRISGEESGNQINEKLHSARMEMVKQLLPPAEVILDLGGYSSCDPRGALLGFGYPHVPQKLYILDFHPDKMMFPGPEWPKQVKYETCDIEYVYGSMTDLDCFQEGTFDLIWSGESIEHITPEDAEKVFSKAYKLLKPGGKLALDTPNRRATKLQLPNSYIHPEHKIEYYYEDLCKLLEKHNFKIIQSQGVIDLSKSIETSSMEHFKNEFISSEKLNDNPNNSYCFFICCMRAEDC